jgi:FMN-dependent NADH-azoreductase
VQEFLDADVVVIGAPMYNFTISSQLKAWIDRVSVAGKTFRYTEQGAEGLAGGRTVIIASTRGGLYGAETPAAAADFQEPYLRCVFGFLGVSDLRFVRAEGLAYGPDARQAALDAALASAPALAA